MGVGNSRGGTGKCPHSIEAPWRIYYNGFMPYGEQRISYTVTVLLFCCEKNNDRFQRKKDRLI
jgi:hypothetical protein